MARATGAATHSQGKAGWVEGDGRKQRERKLTMKRFWIGIGRTPHKSDHGYGARASVLTGLPSCRPVPATALPLLRKPWCYPHPCATLCWVKHLVLQEPADIGLLASAEKVPKCSVRSDLYTAGCAVHRHLDDRLIPNFPRIFPTAQEPLSTMLPPSSLA